MNRSTRPLRMACACAFATFLVCAFAPPAAAQEVADTFHLGELVVSATRLPIARHAVPAAVTVLAGDDLRARGIRSLADALRTVPGAQIVSSGPTGSLTALFLRGGEADYVQVLIDGVPVNEPGGAFDFAHIDTHDIERVEIVRGPVSVLYGTDAVAGVIQIFTRRGVPGAAVRASIETGVFDRRGTTMQGTDATGRGATLSFDAGTSGGTDRVRYSFGAARSATEGILPVNNAYENRSASAQLRWIEPWSIAARTGTSSLRTTMPARSDLAVTARLTDYRYHFPTDGGGRVVDLNQRNTGTSLAVGVDAGRYLTERIETRAGFNVHRGRTGFEDLPDSPADTLGFFAAELENRTTRTGIDARTNWFTSPGVVTLGIAAEWQNGSSWLESHSEFGPFETGRADARASRAAYAQLVANPLATLSLTVGGRVDHSNTFGVFATHRLGANLRLARHSYLRAAIGTAFKEPTFYENFAEGFVQGNPDLDPERTSSREIGLSHSASFGHVALTVFHQRFADMIQFDGRPRSQRLADPNYFNLAGARARGFETEARLQATRSLGFTAGYTLLDTIVLDAGEAADRAFLRGLPLLRRAKHTGSLHATYAASATTTLNAVLNAVGARDDLDFANDWEGQRVQLDLYSTLDVGANVALGRLRGAGEVALRVNVRNALDARYEEIRNFPVPGRVLLLGLRAGR